ncbi:receptor-type adenylate cyclase [Leishmania panamensis]|uniref:Receptor-type adenylate cyclase n=1 Tax=Leishmania panamensis TaxID=5679 RepID=A0A088RP69_LEIPA
MHAGTPHPRRICGRGAGGVAGGLKRLHTYRRSPLLAAALLIVGALTLAVFTAPTAWAAGAGILSEEPVYLLNAMYSMTDYMASYAEALWLGIDAALYNAGYTAAGGRPIRIIDPDPDVNRADIVAVVTKALKDYPTLLGVIGPYSDTRLAALLSSPVIQSSGLMLLGPFTGSSAVRAWNENVYFMRAEPRAELLAIVKHVANTIRGRRTAFMYLTGVDFGEREYEDIVALMTPLGLEPPALYSAPHSMTDFAVDMTAFDAMANTYPHVIILWGMPGRQVAEFLRVALTDPRTSSAYIMTCFPLQKIAFQVYYDLAMAGKLTPVDGQLMSSATSFPLTQPNTTHIPAFRAEMGKYMEQTGRVDESLWADEAKAVREYGSGGHEPPSSDSAADVRRFFNEHPNAANLMLTGWIFGSVIMQTFAEEEWIVDRTAYQGYAFEQRRYIIGGDYVLGDYGAPCNPVAAFLGAVCYCNQGGRAAIVSKLDSATWNTIEESGFNYAQNDCYSTHTSLPRPLHFLTLVFTDDPTLAVAGLDLNVAISALVRYLKYTEHPVSVTTLNVQRTTAQALLDHQLLNYTADVVAGAITKGMRVDGYLVPAPVYPRPHLVEPMRNYVYLMPTLEQQMFLLYENLATLRRVTSIGSGVRVVLHGYADDEASSITAVLYKSAATFNYNNPSVVMVPSTKTVGSALVRRQINFVLAVTAADVADVVDFLIADKSAIVVMVFDDLALHYTALVTALSSTPASVQARVITFTNLPLWSDTSSSAHDAFPMLQVFHGALPDPSQHTPSFLRACVTALVPFKLMRTVKSMREATLADALYFNGITTRYGMAFGIFEWGCTTTASGDDCIYENYGAQSIVMLSVQRMLDPRVPPLTAPMTPSLVYRPRVASSALTPAERNGIIAGVVLLVVASIAAVGLLLYCCMGNRDNDAAPKDGDEPVTLVFTDIESSTALWAVLPQLMADAIVAHHRVIRQLIVKHGCYEVKTVGDSFMIACKSAHSAVRLACEIQTKLLGHDWGTVSIDAAYREFELARADADDDYVPPTARLSEEEYAAVWCGLRVRVGVHTGLCDIRYDEVTKGYDYYGDTPNMAARTEAIANGGQVVATETAWWALSNEERAGAAHTAMGRQGLRGVPFAVEMFQVDAVPGRRHAALRTEIEAILPDETATETASSAAGALLSSVGTMSGPAAGIALVLTSCFAPYPVAQRVRELQPLLSKWGVGAPPRSRAVSEEDYCQGLMNRLALRIATVSQARQRMGKGGAVVAGDMPDVDAGGALNPLVGGGGCGVGGAAPRPSGMTAPPRSGVPSAVRDLRMLRT